MSLDLGVVGNGTIAGLINARGDYEWLCLPRFDGEPVFNKLLGGGGTFSVWMEGLAKRSQTYDRNTAILRTRMEAEDGSILEIVDFAPRFQNKGRTFRPASLVRRFEVLAGAPQLTISLTPETGLGRTKAETHWGGEPCPVCR